MKVGIGNAYKEYDKGWVGINGVWKEVEKMWVGINGVWKEIEGLQKILEYLGVVTPLAGIKRWHAGANNPNYAIFAGGSNPSNYLATVDAYSKSLVRSSPTALSEVRDDLAGSSVGIYAIFAGGSLNNGLTYSYKVDAYNTSLSRVIPTEILFNDKYRLTGSNNPNFAMFCGGSSRTASRFDRVEAYNASLVKSMGQFSASSDTDTSEWEWMAGANAGNYGIFTKRYRVSAFDTSFIRFNPTQTSPIRPGIKNGASIGGYAIFNGGADVNGAFKGDVYAYDSSLTYLTLPSVPVPSFYMGVTSEEFAFFINQLDGQQVYVYDKSLVRTTPAGLNEATEHFAAAAIGNYILVSGGSKKYSDYATLNKTHAYIIK